MKRQSFYLSILLIFGITASCVYSFRPALNISSTLGVSMGITGATLGMLYFINGLLRKTNWYHEIFRNKFNPFSTSYDLKKKYDLERVLMFEKIIEVLHEMNLRIKKQDLENYKIIAHTKMRSDSWGENIYIELNEVNNCSEISFSSVASQMPPFSKNRENADKVFEAIDKSLII